MRTIGVTLGASEPPSTIWRRLSMYCIASLRARMSQGLCSISKTTPSYGEPLRAMPDSLSGVDEGGERGLALLERADDAVQSSGFHRP